jgi:6-phosphogluconate dehydrogenase
MRIGFVGLGRMGAGMTRRLLRHDHQVVAHDRDPSVAMDLSGAEAADPSIRSSKPSTRRAWSG